MRARCFSLCYLTRSTCAAAAACWCAIKSGWFAKLASHLAHSMSTSLFICLVERVTVRICNPPVFIALLVRPADAVPAGGQCISARTHTALSWSSHAARQIKLPKYNGTLIVECRFKFKIADWSHTSTESRC